MSARNSCSFLCLSLRFRGADCTIFADGRPPTKLRSLPFTIFHRLSPRFCCCDRSLQYYRATHDKQFLAEHAYPVLNATAQYWQGRATARADRSAHILDVMGPDEWWDTRTTAL